MGHRSVSRGPGEHGVLTHGAGLDLIAGRMNDAVGLSPCNLEYIVDGNAEPVLYLVLQ